MGREINVAYGYGENRKKKCVVTRVAIGFRAGYHNVKVAAENKNSLLKINYWKYITENTLLKIHYWKHITENNDVWLILRGKLKGTATW